MGKAKSKGFKIQAQPHFELAIITPPDKLLGRNLGSDNHPCLQKHLRENPMPPFYGIGPQTSMMVYSLSPQDLPSPPFTGALKAGQRMGFEQAYRQAGYSGTTEIVMVPLTSE